MNPVIAYALLALTEAYFGWKMVYLVASGDLCVMLLMTFSSICKRLRYFETEYLYPAMSESVYKGDLLTTLNVVSRVGLEAGV